MNISKEIAEVEKLLALPQSQLSVSRQSLWTRLQKLNDSWAYQNNKCQECQSELTIVAGVFFCQNCGSSYSL